MNSFKHLIVGGGMAADSAAQGIRSMDENASIGMISAEPDPPYDRPPLSKGLWKGKPVETIWRNTEAHGVTLFRERRVVTLNPRQREVVDHRGATYRYDKLLLATGGTPRRHFADGAIPIYYRTLEDYRLLRRQTETGRRFVVIGGGFIGSEMAAALAMNGQAVTMAFLENGIGGCVLPPDLAALVTRHYEERGVRVLPGKGVTSIAREGGAVRVRLGDGTTLTADAVVAGLGIAPNVELAVQAGLAVGNGIVVDEQARTSRPNIFAAGDVACFPCPVLKQTVRLEHEDHANATGMLAGRNMAGAGESYDYLPYFYSDLFDTSYEAVGETNPTLHTVTEWVEPYRKGAIFYLKGTRVRGVLFWNIVGKIGAARDLIRTPKSRHPRDIKAWVHEKLK